MDGCDTKEIVIEMLDLTLFLAIAAVFMAVTIYLGWLGYKRTVSNEQFMIGGRKMNPVILALSYGATFLSTAAIIGFGGISALYGMGTIWLMALNILVGLIVAFLIFGKRTRKLGKEMGALSFPDFLGRRFKSPFIQIFSASVIIVGMPIYAAAVLLGGVNFIGASLDIDKDIALLILSLVVAVYVAYGGIVAVMYNDALQGAILFIGMLVLLIFTYSVLGGVTAANQALTDMAINPGVGGLAAAGMTGWTSFPTFGSPLWYTFVTTFILGVGIGALAQPQLAVRYMTADSSRSLNKAMMVGGVFILVIVGAAYTIGPLTNVYFFEKFGMTAIQYTGNTDMIIPTFVNLIFADVFLGDIFVALFLLALICAALSTLSSLLHTMGSSAGYDIWRYIRAWRGGVDSPMTVMAGKDGGLPKVMRASRIGTMIMMILVVVITYYMPVSIIAKATAIFMGFTAATLLPAYTHGIFCDRPNKSAAKLSIVTGAFSWSIWAFFIHTSTSVNIGLCRAIFGKDSLATLPWTNIDPLIIGLPVSIITLIAVLLVARYRSEALPNAE